MKSLLIRAEDKNRWERRAPLIPTDLKELISKNKIEAYIQKSDKRFFDVQDYIANGAILCDGMDTGDVILGIKEIPEHKILPNKVYTFFSHTIKSQSENMSMLKKIIDSKSTLIDYEKITDDNNRRLIYFGRFAGDVGAINILWLMGENWAHKGYDTPFARLKQATNYHSIKDAQHHIQEIGELIKNKGLPKEISPMIIGVLGYGNVSIGTQQIFDCLPVERIQPEELKSFIVGNSCNPNKIYLIVFKEEHLVKQKENKLFELQDYYNYPENYISQFEQYLPYLTILINAIYWEKSCPRFVTWEALNKLYANGENRLNGICDITCDVNGSIECNIKTTNSGMPAYLCDPRTKTIKDGHKGDGIVLLAVDNLPAEIPNDSSQFFSNKLKKFIPNMLSADYNTSLDDSGLMPELKKAVIVYNGELTKSYQYIK